MPRKRERAMKKFLTLMVLIIAAELGAIAAIYTVNTNEQAKNNAVYQVCQTSRVDPRIDERGCADVQDIFGREYVCRDANTDVSNICWVERGLRAIQQ